MIDHVKENAFANGGIINNLNSDVSHLLLIFDEKCQA